MRPQVPEPYCVVSERDVMCTAAKGCLQRGADDIYRPHPPPAIGGGPAPPTTIQHT